MKVLAPILAAVAGVALFAGEASAQRFFRSSRHYRDWPYTSRYYYPQYSYSRYYYPQYSYSRDYYPSYGYYSRYYYPQEGFYLNPWGVGYRDDDFSIWFGR